MHALHSLILIAITAGALLGAETASSSEGTPRAIHQYILPSSRRRPGMLPAVSSLALLIATIVGFLGARCYSSIKGHSPNGLPGQQKRNMAEGGQSPCLDDDDDDDDDKKFPSLKELGATAAPDDDKELGATAAPDDDKELGATAAPDDPDDPDHTIKPVPAQPVAAQWFTVEKMDRREKARRHAVVLLARERLEKIELQKPKKIILETEKFLREGILEFAKEGFDRVSKYVLKDKVPIEEDETTWFLAALYLRIHEDYKTKVKQETGKSLEEIGVEDIPNAIQSVAWKFIQNLKLTSKFMLDLEAVESRMRFALRLVKPTVMEKVMAAPTMRHCRENLSLAILIYGLYYILQGKAESKNWLNTFVIPTQVQPWLKQWEREIYIALDKAHPWTSHSMEFYKAIQAYKKEIVDLLLRYYK
uniref:Uncharacterized protein n=1 Tax=Eimeria tenella TaxID=5802 RepID=H9B9N6_EIMTE|nr:hypothetical protein [Eimeria tenella]